MMIIPGRWGKGTEVEGDGERGLKSIVMWSRLDVESKAGRQTRRK